MTLQAVERDLDVPPHNDDAEQAVLGSVLKNPASLVSVGWLKPDDFYGSQNRHVFAAMLAVAAAGCPPEYTLVIDQLHKSGTYERAGGLDYLADINLATPSAAYIEYYGRIVERTAVQRRIISTAQRMAEVAYLDRAGDADEAIDAADRALDAVRRRRELTTARNEFRAVSLTELRQRPPQESLIDQVLMMDTIAMLEGHSDVYKTFLALDWAHCVALGQPWAGRAVRQGRVLYLLGEGAGGLVRRADAWQICHLGSIQPVDELLFVLDDMPQLWRGDATAVVAANPGPFALVVCDTLSRTFVGGNENTQQDMGLLVAGCDELRRAYPGAVILLLHHLNLAGNTRGSSVLKGALTTLLRLERIPNTRRLVQLLMHKQKDGDLLPSLDLVARVVELGTLDEHGRQATSLVLEPQKEGQSATDAEGSELALFLAPLRASERAALEALLALELALPSVSYAAWRDATGGPGSTFKLARLNLIRRQLVTHTRDGHYASTDAGKQEGQRGPTEGQFSLEGSANGGGPTRATHSLRSVAHWPPGPANGIDV